MRRLLSRGAWTFPMTVAFLAAAFVLAPYARAQQPDTPSVEARNMQLVGGFSDGYVGSELYLQPAYAIVGNHDGVSVPDIGSPAARQHQRRSLTGIPTWGSRRSSRPTAASYTRSWAGLSALVATICKSWSAMTTTER